MSLKQKNKNQKLTIGLITIVLTLTNTILYMIVERTELAEYFSYIKQKIGMSSIRIIQLILLLLLVYFVFLLLYKIILSSDRIFLFSKLRNLIIRIFPILPPRKEMKKIMRLFVLEENVMITNIIDRLGYPKHKAKHYLELLFNAKYITTFEVKSSIPLVAIIELISKDNIFYLDVRGKKYARKKKLYY